jgi:hypothetical protein
MTLKLFTQGKHLQVGTIRRIVRFHHSDDRAGRPYPRDSRDQHAD